VSSLTTPLRKQLAVAIQRARTVAETGARNALQALAVHEADPYRHMSDAQRELRRKLRAQARQLGDTESKRQRGTLDIAHLVEKLAYDQWHRLLFARYLLENNLLISPAHQVSVSLDDCEELAPSEGLKDAWAVAARYAAKELPEIFRADDPAGAVDLPLEDRAALVALVTGLPAHVFTASDSLGWCYQFWQAEKKDAVNASGTKIGADELPSVTQLFTEDYMVDFLLDNTLGAWHAGKVLLADLTLAVSDKSENEIRQAVALPGCAWSYLRFDQKDGQWTPAAGTFDGWPKAAAAIKALDPCMGSGHFVVAMFERLVALRMAEEAKGEAEAIAAVIRDNLFGLEIDARCTQIAAFNVALAAWRRAGHCRLPAMNLACSGLAPNIREADWLVIAGDNEKLKNGMARLYRLFKDAPILGSLINPRAAEGDLLEAGFHELQTPLEKALAQESTNDTNHEMGVTAQGLAKAAEILSGQFSLVSTNVPYLGRGKQNETLKYHLEEHYQEGKSDLAAAFVERCLLFCATGGSTALVTPQAWLYLAAYTKMRESLLSTRTWNLLVLLGEEAWRTFGVRGPRTVLSVLSATVPKESSGFWGIDVSASRGEQPVLLEEKVGRLSGRVPVAMSFALQAAQLRNPDAVVQTSVRGLMPSLGEYADSWQGLVTCDDNRFMRSFWELPRLSGDWARIQQPPDEPCHQSGKHLVVYWQEGLGDLHNDSKAHNFPPAQALNRRGVAIQRTNKLFCTRMAGELFGDAVAPLIPRDESSLIPIWCFAESGELARQVRLVDAQVKVAVGSFLKVPFDLAHWQKVAAERYPNGLPQPYSSDPTQWLFDGHSKSVNQPMHVAVARLLGYQWPRGTGCSVSDCPPLGPDGLETLADDDGIVPITAIKGEAAAAERLRELLALGYDRDWSVSLQEQLLAQVGFAGASLEDWLRNGFFEQHCALFHQRPFIWHVWDGRKDGFSALVNYHKLTHANLEKLTFAYLGDWIRRQQAAVDAGEAGSDARLQAAKQLQARLKLILEGEPPFDLFVRWKPLAQQAVGWHPDINDGVRMNIRPFLAQDIPGGKKGAGILRVKPSIKWDKDRGNELVRDKKAYPWFWGWDGQATDFPGVATKPDGNRWNACHYTNAFKQRARDAQAKK
jgi:hypothetical protein